MTTVTRDPVTNLPIDPVSIVVTVRRPDKTTFTPSVNHESTGKFTAKVVADQVGRYFYRWVSAGGDYIGADERHFSVGPTAF